MQVTETLNEGLKRGYAIKVPASELESKVTEKLEEARKDFQMKGFRKGKAPAALMKKMFGKSVLGEAMQESIDAAMRSHFEATGDRPALQPEVKMTEDETIKTAACDGTTIRYNPKFVDSLPLSKVQGLIAHEVMHPAFLHHTRRGARDKKKWNQACCGGALPHPSVSATSVMMCLILARCRWKCV